MIHQPSGGAQGMASDIAIQAEEIIKLRARYLLPYSTSRAAFCFRIEYELVSLLCMRTG